MVLDFAQINSGISVSKQIDPRKIFTTLNRDPRFKRPSDEQADVLDSWFARKNEKDITIKMNTGSGKTLVGLLALQSSLNDGVYPAVYVTPDNYLLQQVIKEAKHLGINTTQDENDPEFSAGRAILVINIWKLINGKSVFGIDSIKIKVGALVFDDAHACLATVADQFSMQIDSTHDIYKKLLKLFKNDLSNQSFSGTLDVEAGDPRSLLVVPYWAWKNHLNDVMSILHPYRNDDAIMWSWALLNDVLAYCQCTFSGNHLEITPSFIPIDHFPSLAQASRRIYMTATLADDSILVSHFQADPNLISTPIRPKGGGDIGDRMILSPQEINPTITPDEIKGLIHDLSKTHNVSVIVPSEKKSQYWSDIAAQILKADNLEFGVERMKKGHVGLSVLINKYDGIDLPGNACRVLVVDGLPEVSTLSERVEYTVLEGTRSQMLRQIQRIEQGMGRGVRSSEDYCVVILTGSRLTQCIHAPEARSMFGAATQAQIDLAQQVAKQAKGKSLTEIRSIIELCLQRDNGWVSTSRNAVVNAPEKTSANIDPITVGLRQAFDSSRIQRPDLALKAIQQAISSASDKTMKGYLLQQLANYTHDSDPTQAQELQLTAIANNQRLLKPIKGIRYAKLATPAHGQAKTATQYMSNFLEGNDLLIWVNALLESLEWGEENSHKFEKAMRDLGAFLGFGSHRPEEETGRGPDNLWALGEANYLVIECKSGATSAQQKINKHDCNQLTGSMAWFSEQYSASDNPIPIMVHPQLVPEYAATMTPNARIIDKPHLSKLHKCLEAYANALSNNNNYTNDKEVANQLYQFSLTAKQFVDAFTTTPKHK